jgi:tetratricopeptide (TPR) repeat protein
MAVATGGRVLEARCSPFAANSALRPVGDLVLAALGASGRVPVGHELASLLRARGVEPAEGVPMLAHLLGITGTEVLYPAPLLSPQARKGRTVQLALQLVLGAPSDAPSLVLVEDAHWIDASSLEFLGLLAGQARERATLLTITSRTDPSGEWVADVEVALSRLSREGIERLVTHATGGRALPGDVLGQILAKADGNALFAQELTRMVLESGLVAEDGDGLRAAVQPLPPLAIPSTLHDSLMARLDRLVPPRRALVQLCATIGRQVSWALVNEVLSGFDEEIRQELAQITEGDLLYQRGAPPSATFVFRHALVQDAAYNSLLRRKRAAYHGRVADVLSHVIQGSPPEIIAHHLTEAGRIDEAVGKWLAAGRAALEAFGLAEAVHHLSRGLSLVPQLVDPAAAALAELRLRATLGVPLIFRHGFASSEVRANCDVLLQLCDRVEGSATQEKLAALWGLWQVNEVAGRYDEARAMGERLLRLAASSGDSAVAVSAHTAFGAAILMPGDLAGARRHFEAGLALYDMAAHAGLAMWFGQDVGAMCASFLTWTEELAGRHDRAVAHAQEALAMADRLGQPGTRGFVETVLATWCGMFGDHVAGLRHSDLVMRLAAEQGMPHWAAQAGITRGWALAIRGEREGADVMRQCAGGLMAMGARASMSMYYAGMIEAELQRGRPEVARATLTEADAYVAETGERLYEAGLAALRVRVERACGSDASSIASAQRRAAELAEEVRRRGAVTTETERAPS